MQPGQLWQLLCELAESLGVQVRLERLDMAEEYLTKAGLCRMGGKTIAFVEKTAGVGGRCRQLGLALCGLDLDAVFVRPAVRQYLRGLAGAAPGAEFGQEEDF